MLQLSPRIGVALDETVTDHFRDATYSNGFPRFPARRT
jgi:hypothetical protein